MKTKRIFILFAIISCWLGAVAQQTNGTGFIGNDATFECTYTKTDNVYFVTITKLTSFNENIDELELDLSVFQLDGEGENESSVVVEISGHDNNGTWKGAFEGNTQIETIHLPAELTTIGENAFKDCTGLMNVYFHDDISLEKINDNAFSGCESLGYFGDENNTSGKQGYEAYIKNNRVQYKEATIYVPLFPDRVEKIGDFAFYQCKNLCITELPSTIKQIGASAFGECSTEKTAYMGGDIIENCSQLTGISDKAFFESGIKGQLTFPSGLTTIGESAFEDCKNITGNLTLPSTITSIGKQAFYKCKINGSIDFTQLSNLNTVGIGAFRNCSELEGIVLPTNASFTTIPGEMFSGCTKLTTCEIPSQITSIGASAFAECGFSNGIVIPAGVTTIGENAFDGITNSGTITFLSNGENINSIGSNAFPTNVRKYIPFGTTSNYFANGTCLGKFNGNFDSNGFTWEKAETLSSNAEEGLEFSELLPTRVDNLTVESTNNGGNGIVYHNKGLEVWNQMVIRRTLDEEKYYYITLPWDVEAADWGNNFKVLEKDSEGKETEVTDDYTVEYETTEGKIDYKGYTDGKNGKYMIYKFSGERFANERYNDDAYEYVTYRSQLMRVNAYAFGVGDLEPNNNLNLTFEFTHDCTTNHYEPYGVNAEFNINTEFESSATPWGESHKRQAHNLSNWNMLANPYMSSITLAKGGSSNFALYGDKNIEYMYTIELDTEGKEVTTGNAEKAYYVNPKTGSLDDVTVDPQAPIFVQTPTDASTLSIRYSPVEKEEEPQSIPAAYRQGDDHIELELFSENSSARLDRTIIFNDNTASDEYVIGEDFYRMFNAGCDHIYTMIGDSIECFANKLNLETTNRIIPLAFRIANPGDFKVSVKNKVKITDFKVYLRDLTDNTVTDLLMNDPTLHLGNGRIEGDYQIEIDYAPTAVSAVENDGNSKVYVLADGILHIDNLGSSVVSLYDATGKLLSITDPHSDNLELTLPAHGIYFVNLRGSENSTVKVVY